MSWNITIRKARLDDRRYYDWRPYFDEHGGPYKPTIVSVDGEPFLCVRLRTQASPTVLWQNGSKAVAPLLRLLMQYDDALWSALADDRWDKANRKRERERVR